MNNNIKTYVLSRQAIANSVKYLLSPGTQYMAGASLSFAGVTLFQKLTVKEFLWGYEDPFLRTAKSVIKSKHDVDMHTQ